MIGLTIPAAAPPFSLSISLSQDHVVVGEEVRVIVVQKNTSDHDLVFQRPIGSVGQEYDTKVEVRDERGQLASETEYGHEANGNKRDEQEEAARRLRNKDRYKDQKEFILPFGGLDYH